MNILIVKDDSVIADVIGMIPEESGHFSTVAHTIEASLTELRLNRIDAELLDINLPYVNSTRLA